MLFHAARPPTIHTLSLHDALPIYQPVPLARGYATFASDSGHQANASGSLDGRFLVNDEALRNFGGQALKKTRDAARSEEHTSELQSQSNLVCRPLLDKKNLLPNYC